jgi:ribonuclease HI
MRYVPNAISQSMNDNLVREFSAGEVDQALKQMAPLTAPGPDGLPPLFYQKYWHVVGPEVTSGVLSCLNSGKVLSSINHTYITLIPKVKNPEKVTEFRPISLCNVIYKLVSKVIANRLKLILPKIISESQSAFVPGRLITDNILVAFETLHHMNSTRIGRDGAMALKLDMSKAYDRVEWVFLEKIMGKMGFHNKFIGLIMSCIKSVSYSILINGEPHGFIKPSRGLRQGDPLSPYLFLLVAEGLNSLISQAASEGSVQGISLCRSGPRITHLFFADDSLLFSRATLEDCAKIQEILSTYEKASGQQVNRDKTTLFFSKGTSMHIQDSIKVTLGVPIIRQYEKYLGLPSLVGRNRSASFSQIKEKVWSKLKGWKEKLLSQAGREILIKAVAQAIPTYSMSCFKLPIRLCQDLEAMIRKFWWGHEPNQNKVSWVRWKSLCHPKGSGGMGFRELRKFNDALLGKQVWRLLQDPSSQFHRVFKAKFFPNGSILDANPRTRGSYAWQSILKARDIIIKGAVWRVGNGKSINIWNQRWLPEESHRTVISPPPAVLLNSTVSELMIPNSQQWDFHLIDQIFLPYDASAIKNIPLSSPTHKDSLFWPGSKNGQYSVKSGYRFLVEEELKTMPSCSNTVHMNSIWKSVWELQVPRKIQLFIWRALKDSLPTKLNLMKRHVLTDPVCEQCQSTPEDTLHAVWRCPEIQAAWSKEDWLGDIPLLEASEFLDVWCQVLKLSNPDAPALFSTICWFLWNRRNKLRVRKPAEKPERIASVAKGYLEEFRACQIIPSPIQKPASNAPIRWEKPRQGFHKLNYDGAIFNDSNEAGIGVVARDHNGLCIATLSQKIRYPHSVDITEALAARRAVQFARELGLHSVEFEGDSTCITDALNGNDFSQAAFGLILDDVKQLALSLPNHSFHHVKRNGNKVAHALARRAKHCNTHQVWRDSYPLELEPLLHSDCSI